MAARRIRQTGKNSDRDIISLCNTGEPWSPRTKADAIADMRSGSHSYYVDEAGYKTDVHVTSGGDLRTDADQTSKNNLDNLPDC